jgi:hypothetical protein
LKSAIPHLASRQTAVCARALTEPAFLQPKARVGIGRDFNPAQMPINGLRHPTHGNMCGWYIWSGEELSQDADYFEVVCYEHLVNESWEWLVYLALPAGWRFLSAPGYEDIWFDDGLLNIERF